MTITTIKKIHIFTINKKKSQGRNNIVIKKITNYMFKIKSYYPYPIIL